MLCSLRLPVIIKVLSYLILPILESDAEYHLMENMAAFGETVTSHLFILQGHQSQKHAQLCTLFRK